MAMTPEQKLLKKKLKKIHKEVYARFKYVTDRKQFGVSEYWTTPENRHGVYLHGDCEDFALKCRERCREEGITETNLLVCVLNGYPPGKGGHCVLYIHGYIMDCNKSRLTTVNKMDSSCRWVSGSGHEFEDPWRKVTGMI